MDFCVNPLNCSKEEWLKLRGFEISSQGIDWWVDVPLGFFPVVLVDSGPSMVARIACSEEELTRLVDFRDQRSKKIFLVEIAALLGVAPEFAKWYKEGNSVK